MENVITKDRTHVPYVYDLKELPFPETCCHNRIRIYVPFVDIEDLAEEAKEVEDKKNKIHLAGRIQKVRIFLVRVIPERNPFPPKHDKIKPPLKGAAFLLQKNKDHRRSGDLTKKGVSEYRFDLLSTHLQSSRYSQH